jgi:hypothetical protein
MPGLALASLFVFSFRSGPGLWLVPADPERRRPAAEPPHPYKESRGICLGPNSWLSPDQRGFGFPFQETVKCLRPIADVVKASNSGGIRRYGGKYWMRLGPRSCKTVPSRDIATQTATRRGATGIAHDGIRTRTGAATEARLAMTARCRHRNSMTRQRAVAWQPSPPPVRCRPRG